MSECDDPFGRGVPPASADSLLALRAARRVAAPSWVVPASLVENCRFLAGKVDEVGLLFFDMRSSLAYDGDDLPPDLAWLSPTYHVHLPLDLPWHDPTGSAEACRVLLERCSFLARTGAPGTDAAGSSGLGGGIRAVLHPPARGPGDDWRLMEAFLHRFVALGGEPGLLLLENTPDNDLAALDEVIAAADLGVCLDLGHMLACGQELALLRGEILTRARMLHLSAPGTGSAIRHLPLTALDGNGLETGRRLCRDAPPDAVVMVELFSWPQIEQSLPVLRSWLLPEG